MSQIVNITSQIVIDASAPSSKIYGMRGCFNMVGSVVFRYRLNAWSPPLTWWTGRLGGCLLVFLAGVGTLAQEGQPTAEQ
ncbi:MAG: hypothetical protein ACK53L_11110, partial [Pirellulaceae bacterium]